MEEGEEERRRLERTMVIKEGEGESRQKKNYFLHHARERAPKLSSAHAHERET